MNVLPLVVVVRDPDASNEYAVFDGPVETYDIDCGRADLRDPAEYEEWRENHLAAVQEYERDGRQDVADYIRGVIDEYRPGAETDSTPSESLL